MTTARVIIGILALGCESACGIASSLVSFEMVERVNERLPKDQQFAPLWWYWSKNLRLWREYKVLYPDVSLLRNLRALGVLIFVCLFTGVWDFGFFAVTLLYTLLLCDGADEIFTPAKPAGYERSSLPGISLARHYQPGIL